MSFQQMKPFWIGGALFGFLFAVLFSIRIDLFQKVRQGPFQPPFEGDALKIGRTVNKKIEQAAATHMAILDEIDQQAARMGLNRTEFLRRLLNEQSETKTTPQSPLEPGRGLWLKRLVRRAHH